MTKLYFTQPSAHTFVSDHILSHLYLCVVILALFSLVLGCITPLLTTGSHLRAPFCLHRRSHHYILPNTRLPSLLSSHLQGSIPAELFQLGSLSTVEMANNWLSGSLPSSLGSAVSLKFIDVSYSCLVGIIPGWMGPGTMASVFQYVWLVKIPICEWGKQAPVCR